MAQYCKVGFHAGGGGNQTGIGDYMRKLDQAGIPFCVKSAENVGLAVEAAQYARASGVPHNILLRWTNPGDAHDDVPDWNLPPEQSAQEHWDRVLININRAPEMAPFKDLIWIEPTNEIDTHTQAEFLGWFSYYISKIANEQGYRVALSGHNAGQPEPEHWRLPGFQAFLQYCADNPEMAAVSLHEGKIGDINAHPETYYPHLIGRFTWLYDACDEMGIARPTTFISEWAWKYNKMPGQGTAMRDVKWLSELVAKYPTLRGIYLWNLAGGPQWAGLPNQLQKMIAPITEYTLSTRFPDPPVQPRPVSTPRTTQPTTTQPVQPAVTPAAVTPAPSAGRGQPRVQYDRTYLLLPPKAGKDWVYAAVDATWEQFGYTIGKSPDDAGVGELNNRAVIAVNPDEWGPGEDGNGLQGFFAKYYPEVKYKPVVAATPAQLQSALATLG